MDQTASAHIFRFCRILRLDFASLRGISSLLAPERDERMSYMPNLPIQDKRGKIVSVGGRTRPLPPLSVATDLGKTARFPAAIFGIGT